MHQQTDHFESPADSLDFALTRALEAPPQTVVPADFAARLLSRLPADTLTVRASRVWPTSIAEPQIGRRTAFAAAAVLLAAFMLLPLLIPHSAASHQFAYMAVLGVFAAEFIFLTVWLSLRADTLS